MADKRIESKTSRTAEWTCVSRAVAALDRNPFLHGEDFIAPQMIPQVLRALFHLSPIRFIYKACSPNGLHCYVIARTRYMDDAFRRAMAEGFGQVLIFGAGFDTRGLRFADLAANARIFELDVSITQADKLAQFERRGLRIPANLTFIAVDFDKDSPQEKLSAAGFQIGVRTLFMLEGVVMYLQPESVDRTFAEIRSLAGVGSRVVFDYVSASVIRGEKDGFGGAEASEAVSGAGESWHFGIELGDTAGFLAKFGMTLADEKNAEALERTYLRKSTGEIAGRVNAAHAIVTAEILT